MDTERVIRFGLVFPPASWREAGLVEELGYDSIWAGEHLFFYGPTYEALITLSFFAQQVRNINIGSAVVLVPLRHPVVLAKAAATLDLLSGGRLILGIGVGGEYPKEFEAVGVPVSERGARTNESIRLMRRLWSAENVTFRGRFFRVENVTLWPRPARPGGPPIWVAGRSEAAIRRSARYGDGYLPYLFSPERYRSSFELLGKELDRLGRNPGEVVRGLYQFICVADSYSEARAEAVERLSRQYNQPFDRVVDRYVVLGNPDDCRRRLEEYVAAGVEYFILVPTGRPGRYFEQVRAIAAEVLPRFRRPGLKALAG